MPEGHVLHRLARTFRETFTADALHVSSPQGRFASEAAHLDGSSLLDAEAIGKHLFLRFDVPGPSFVHIHLGLIGKLRVHPLAPPVGAVRLRVDDGATAADLHGPQWCRLVGADEWRATLAASGPDPIRDDAHPDDGLARVRRSGRSIAALLMDQRVAAGVGNIFRAEALFRLRLAPDLTGRDVDEHTWRALWRELQLLMRAAVDVGRIDTVRPEHSPEAQGRPPRVDPHGGEVYVYRRAGQPCLVCGTEVRTRTLEGRNLYWCPRCQRRHRVR